MGKLCIKPTVREFIVLDYGDRQVRIEPYIDKWGTMKLAFDAPASVSIVRVKHLEQDASRTQEGW